MPIMLFEFGLVANAVSSHYALSDQFRKQSERQQLHFLDPESLV